MVRIWEAELEEATKRISKSAIKDFKMKIAKLEIDQDRKSQTLFERTKTKAILVEEVQAL